MDILATLQRLGSGQLLDDLQSALVTTAEEVVTTGKGGKVTLTLNLATQNQGDVMVIIGGAVSRSSPKKDPKASFFFAVDGELHKEDPRQLPLEFRVVETRGGEIRDVPTGREERVTRG